VKKQDKETYLTEEVFVVRHSGEIPEVTFHESLYYLTENPEGPALHLNSSDIITLKHAVVKRYREIILRDLNPENRDKDIYRGLARCLANWQRLHKFCTMEKLDFTEIKAQAANALKSFIIKEVTDVQSGIRSSCINCSQAEIEELSGSLGLSVDDLPKGWQKLCPGT